MKLTVAMAVEFGALLAVELGDVMALEFAVAVVLELDVAVEFSADVAAALGMAVATARIELGLERRAEVEAEQLAELGLTLIINSTMTNLSCKSYDAKKNYNRRTRYRRRTSIVHVLVQKFIGWVKDGAIAAKLGCKTGQKVAYNIKKGGKIFCPPISFSRSEFYVDFDFAVKHDLTL